MIRLAILSMASVLRLLRIGMTAVAVMAGTSVPVVAQQPGRLIKIIVPQTPGTGPDILARLIGAELQKQLGQSVIVINRTGASGNIGTQVAAQAGRDGNTLMIASSPSFVTNTYLFKNLPYDPRTDFAPIIEIAHGSIALVVHPSVPVASAPEFLEYIRKRPGQINYGSPGTGTPHHLVMELFKFRTRTNLVHVPYRGTAGALTDLLGGHVSAMFLPTHVALPLAKDGRIRILAVASGKRVLAAPDVATLGELGISGVEFDSWFGLVAPAGTSPETVARLNTIVNEILRSPHIIQQLGQQGLATVGGPPERLRTSIENDFAEWPVVFQEAGIKAE